MSAAEDRYRSVVRSLDRLEGASRELAKPAARAPEPLTAEQAARAQGAALLRHLEASVSPTVTLPAVGGSR